MINASLGITDNQSSAIACKPDDCETNRKVIRVYNIFKVVEIIHRNCTQNSTRGPISNLG
jgi:hypothetical protein